MQDHSIEKEKTMNEFSFAISYLLIKHSVSMKTWILNRKLIFSVALGLMAWYSIRTSK